MILGCMTDTYSYTNIFWGAYACRHSHPSLISLKSIFCSGKNAWWQTKAYSVAVCYSQRRQTKTMTRGLFLSATASFFFLHLLHPYLLPCHGAFILFSFPFTYTVLKNRFFSYLPPPPFSPAPFTGDDDCFYYFESTLVSLLWDPFVEIQLDSRSFILFSLVPLSLSPSYPSSSLALFLLGTLQIPKHQNDDII